MVKSLKFIVERSAFEGSTGCVRERKNYPEDIKNDTKMHPQIDEQSLPNIYSKKLCYKYKKSSKKRTGNHDNP